MRALVACLLLVAGSAHAEVMKRDPHPGAPVPLGIIKRTPVDLPATPPVTPASPPAGVQPVTVPRPAGPPRLRWQALPAGYTSCSAGPSGRVDCGPGYWHPEE